MPKINHQKGVVHLLFLLIIAALIAAGVYFFVYKGGVKLPALPFVSNQPNVQPKAAYANPFKKETQYVNPFDKYKNPFVVNR